VKLRKYYHLPLETTDTKAQCFSTQAVRIVSPMSVPTPRQDNRAKTASVTLCAI
jgi:hypothetical protein